MKSPLSPSFFACLFSLTGLSILRAQTPTPPAPFPVTITVDATKIAGLLRPIWRFFGADEPNYATMKDGRKPLSSLGELKPKDVFFRAHNLLNTGDGTPALKWGSTHAYTEDATGKPVYSWTAGPPPSVSIFPAKASPSSCSKSPERRRGYGPRRDIPQAKVRDSTHGSPLFSE
jgi:hypothetical protein